MEDGVEGKEVEGDGVVYARMISLRAFASLGWICLATRVGDD